MKTSQEIRQALIQIADRNNRPHYALAVVRDVIHAIKNDLDHPLLTQVLTEKIEVVQITRPKTDFDVLKDFCEPRGMVRLLAKHANLSESYIGQLLRQDNVLSKDMFEKLKSAFSRAETDFQNASRQTKGRTHGTYNCYQKGCRCADCRTAMQVMREAKLRAMTIKYVGAAA